MADNDAYVQKLTDANPLRESTLRSAIQTLCLPPGSKGLDIGCGIGLPALLLAEAVGPNGHVTGLDLSPDLLRHAQGIVDSAGMAHRISFRQGHMNQLPFENDAFDWAWSADCVGYPASQSVQALREMARVVRPGGTVAILAWSSQQVLPGYPMLEARLNATCSSYAPFLTGASPEAHFLRALGWFPKVGLVEATPHTIVGEVWAPLSSDIRRALVSLFDMLWGEPQPEVSAEAHREYERLCLPQSPDFVLDLPDYYAFFTYTMFRAKVAQ